MNALQNEQLACSVTISHAEHNMVSVFGTWTWGEGTLEITKGCIYSQILQLIGFLLCSCPWFALGSLPDILFPLTICSTFSYASGNSCLHGLLPVDWVKIDSLIVLHFVSLQYPISQALCPPIFLQTHQYMLYISFFSYKRVLSESFISL